MRSMRFWLFNILAGFLAALGLPGTAAYLFPNKDGAYGTLMSLGLLGLIWALFSLAMTFAVPAESKAPVSPVDRRWEDLAVESRRLELEQQKLLIRAQQDEETVFRRTQQELLLRAATPQQPTIVILQMPQPQAEPAPLARQLPEPVVTVEGTVRELPAPNPRVKTVLGHRLIQSNDGYWYDIDTGDIYNADGTFNTKRRLIGNE